MRKVLLVSICFFTFLLPRIASAQWDSIGPVAVSNDTVGNVSLIRSFGNEVYICTDKGLFVSSDNGDSWQNLTWTKTNTSGLSIKTIHRNGQGKLYIANDSMVYTSTDNGSSWSASGLSPIKTINDISQAPNGDLLISFKGASTSGGVYYSQDDLAGVHKATVSGDPNIQFFLVDGTNLFAGGRDGVYKSTDNGQTWNVSGTGWPGGGGFNTLAKSGSTLYAGSWGGKGLYISNDNGATWVNPDTALFKGFCQVFSVAGGKDTAIATMDGACNGGNPIKASGDDGDTWQPFMSGLQKNYYPVAGANSAGTCFFTFNKNKESFYKYCTETSGIKPGESVTVQPFIYPVPVEGILHLTLSAPVRNGKIVITGITGQVLKTMDSQNGSVFDISVGELQPGLYLLGISTAEGTSFTKFIKR